MLKLQHGAARAHTSYLEATQRAIFSLALYEPARTQPRTLAATNSGVVARQTEDTEGEVVEVEGEEKYLFTKPSDYKKF